MFPFIFLYTITGLNYIRSTLVKRNTHVRLYIVTCILILFFVGLRDVSVGTDTKLYVEFFNSKSLMYNGEKTDFAFEMITRIIKFIFNDQFFFLFVTSLLGLGGIYFLIYKFSENKMLSLLFYLIIGTSTIFFFYIFAAIRQSCSLTLFIISLYYLFEKPNKKSKVIQQTKAHSNVKDLCIAFVLYVIAVLIHGSCLFTFPFVLLAYWRDLETKKLMYGIVGFSFVIGSLSLFSISDSINVTLSYLGLLISRDYSSYGEITFGEIEKAGIINMYLIPFTFIAIFLIKFSTISNLNKWYVKLFLLSVVLNNLFYDNLMWSRFVYYLSIFSIIAIPNLARLFKKPIRIPFYLVVFAYFIYKTISQFQYQLLPAATGNIIVPYKSWLNL
jgi:hypothetical protein